MPSTPAPGRPLAVRDGLTVPYVTLWSGERHISLTDLWLHNGGLRYANEGPWDRDARRGLRERWEGGYGDGEPLWRSVHSERQRTAMEHLLCQVCAHPADRTNKGTLFLVPGSATASHLEETRTSQPPLCLPHALIARTQCPRLRRSHTALRARKTSLWGLHGIAYVTRPRPAHRPTNSLAVDQTCSVAYGTPELTYVLGSQLIRELRRVTVVDLDEEAARLGI